MTQAWTTLVERGTGKAISNPFLFSFISVFLGFIAGVELIWLIQSGEPRSFFHGALDYSLFVYCVMSCLYASFMLACAIRKLAQ